MDHTNEVGGGQVESPRQVEPHGRVNRPSGSPSKVAKVFVAVHGIGDQFSYATIQSVVNQVCTYYGKPAAVPLGSFHTGDQPFSLVPPYESDPFEKFSFAEVYWAEVPRNLVKDQHKLEETKQWARTLVERLRLRWKQRNEARGCRDRDFALVGQVLSEMIQTIAVLNRLTFLANRAGLFTFDLKKLLDDFVGDVQIVTEFSSERKEILKTFNKVMSRVHQDFPNADIYVVAHSEGTVVAFLGLLEAFRDAAQPSWARYVRGFMTIGSPIDKHLLLWPALFANGTPTDRPAWTPDQPIAWRNYYDYGDPVGFELNDARAWLQSNGWSAPADREKDPAAGEKATPRKKPEAPPRTPAGSQGVFEFRDEDDVGFSRYPLPGAAHVAYWTDPAVFGHFIATVVNRGAENPGPRANEFSTPPATNRWNQALSYVLPYVGIGALLAAAAYLLVRAVIGVLPHKPVFDSARYVAGNVLGLAALVFGLTVVARIPRLTRDRFWHVVAIATGVLGAVVYRLCVAGAVVEPVAAGGMPRGLGVLLLSLGVLAAVYMLGVLYPSWGVAPLIVLGTLAAVGGAAYYVIEANADPGPLWPLVLAVLGFLYLWWLAALFFDLIFVWHRYVRHSKALAMMDYVLGGKRPPAWGGRGQCAMTEHGAPHLQVQVR